MKFLLMIFFFFTISMGQSFKNLQSNPSAESVIFLGIYGGDTKGGSATPITDEDVVMKAFESVVEDFYPFNVNITTDQAVYNNTAAEKKTAILLSPWQVGGVAFGKFGDGKEWQAISYIEKHHTISHELGHTLFLPHDGPGATATSGYLPAKGEFASIMGSSYYKDKNYVTKYSTITQWHHGNGNPDSTESEIYQTGDLAKLGEILGYVNDDYSDMTPLTCDIDGNINEMDNPGGIQHHIDTDLFSFSTNGGYINLTIDPANIFSPNLNVESSIRDKNGENIILSGEGSGYFLMGNTIEGHLSAGSYTLFIDGAGKQVDDTLSFYNDYSSFGRYRINGEITGFISETVNTNFAMNKSNKNVLKITGSQLQLNIPGSGNNNVKINIYNLKGVKVIEEIETNLASGKHTIKLAHYGINELAAGHYAITLKISGSRNINNTTKLMIH